MTINLVTVKVEVSLGMNKKPPATNCQFKTHISALLPIYPPAEQPYISLRPDGMKNQEYK